MPVLSLIRRSLLILIGLLGLLPAQAGTALWTFKPLDPTSFNLGLNETVTVRYQVTNQAKKAHTLLLQPTPGLKQVISADSCGSPFTLNYLQSCLLKLEIKLGEPREKVGGPVLCEQGNPLLCYQPSAAEILKINTAVTKGLILAGSPLGLWVNGGSGSLIITNNLGFTATNILPHLEGTALDGLVSLVENNCAKLKPKASCRLIFKAGSTALSPTAFTIRGDNTEALEAELALVNVGNAFGGGTVACANSNFTGDLGNLVVANVDANDGIQAVFGNTGTLLVPEAASQHDGAKNTQTIIAKMADNGGVDYAAALCRSFQADAAGNSPCQPGNRCYTDWYLPAINQLDCVASSVPFLFNGAYWSSTAEPEPDALAFATPPSANFAIIRNTLMNVRCVRNF